MGYGPWCNICEQCTTQGCYDTCSLSGFGNFLLFLVALGCVTVALGVAATFACCFATRRGLTYRDIVKRGFGLTLLLAAGLALLTTLFFEWYEAQGSDALPPCNQSQHGIGLSWSGSKSNGDYFASCPGTLSSLNAMCALIGIAIAVTAVSFLLTIGMRPLWPSAVAGVLALVFLGAALGIHGTQVAGTADFCGSGRSLSELGYTTQSGLRAAWSAFALVAVGGVIHPIVLHLLKIVPAVARHGSDELAPVIASGQLGEGYAAAGTGPLQ